MTLALGVDLGGTKTEAVVVRLGSDQPDVIARARIATERENGYEHIVDRTRALVLEVTKQAGVGDLPIGVGMPGSVTRTGLIKNSNTTCLNGRPFRDDLARAIGRPITFANDANCFALAEATWGAARDARVAFGVILGTGVGGGVVVRDGTGARRAWDGAQGIAGEWGHVVLDPTAGAPCYCGRRGCVETYISGPAIEAAYASRTGKKLALAEIATSEEPAAKELLAERLDVFGRALATVIDVIDPDVVVLGGGVSNVAALYDAGVRAVARWVFSDELVTRIVKHELGDSAGVLGAALLP
jgi:fructokinase